LPNRPAQSWLAFTCFLYITLRQQDYALLMGVIALSVVLAIIMYVTRKVDWYACDAG
jgi:inner membrane protein